MHAFATEGLDIEKREELDALLTSVEHPKTNGSPDTKAKAQRERAAVEAALRSGR